MLSWQKTEEKFSIYLSVCTRRRKVVCVLKSYTPRPDGSVPGSLISSEKAPLTEHAMRLPRSSPALQHGEILIEWKDGTVTPLYESWTLSACRPSPGASSCPSSMTPHVTEAFPFKWFCEICLIDKISPWGLELGLNGEETVKRNIKKKTLTLITNKSNLCDWYYQAVEEIKLTVELDVRGFRVRNSVSWMSVNLCFFLTARGRNTNLVFLFCFFIEKNIF